MCFVINSIKEGSDPPEYTPFSTIRLFGSPIMSNTIYLYLKTHNQTGLKYLGKTVKDPFVYKGSGKRWLSHLAKHGADVSTEILFETTDVEEFRTVALYYSEKMNIVESNEYANLVVEQGDGGFVPRSSESYRKGVKTKIKNQTHLNSGSKRARLKAKETSLKKYGTLKTGDDKSRQRGWETRRNRGTDRGWSKPKESVIKGVETRKNNGTNTWKITDKVTCPHCGKVGAKSGAMAQWHFDNCKNK
jgi:hypothetical protein